MKLKLILQGIAILVSITTVNAQFIERHWQEGNLSWDEFRRSDTSEIETASYFTYYLDYYLALEKRKDTVFYFFKAENFTDKNALFVANQFADSNFLEYHQVLFDISELAKRRMQKSFFAGGRILINANTLLDEAYDDAEEDISQMNEDTNFGLEVSRLREWKDSITNLINKTGDSYMPSYTLKNNGFGAHIGFGGTIHSGGIKNYVKPPVFFNLGVNAQFKKIHTSLDFTFGSGKAIRDTEGKLLWKKDDDVRQYNIMANAGYVINMGRIQFTPYIGGGISGYQYYFIDDFEESFTEGRGSLVPQAGAYLDLFFYKKANFNRIYHTYYNTTPDRSVEAHGIRLNFSFTPVNFSGPLNASGNIYQISVNYVFHNRNMIINN